MRKALAPARMTSSRTEGSSRAGPIVARILARRIIMESKDSILPTPTGCIFFPYAPGPQLIAFAVFLTVVYCALMGFFILGAVRLVRSASRPENSRSPQPIGALAGPPARADATAPGGSEGDSLPSVSVIVPLRNEELHAPATLRALSEQDYAGEWEVICVNDRSTDGTERIIRSLCDSDPRFTLVNIPIDSPAVPSPKKRALAAGFSAARGEILMTTDADCMARRGWLRTMAMRFDPGIGIVQGPKRIRGDGTLISRYQEHEVFGLVSIEAATFALGRPMIASAPSLAYRKVLYESVGGFRGLEDTVSGDDDMLVRKMQKDPRWKVAYNPSPDACVTTSPVTEWGALLQQRARWASNGAHYEEKGFVALLACIYAVDRWLAARPFRAASGWSPCSGF